LLIIFICGCKSTNIEDIENNIDDIKVQIINILELDSGTYYTLEVINNGKELIKYVEVMLGYSVTEDAKKEGITGPIMFQGKTVDNAINLKSGEKKSFIVHVPVPLLKQEKIDMDRIQVCIQGYFTEVKIEKRFQKSGGLAIFNEE
jgi:hypothetical protein